MTRLRVIKTSQENSGPLRSYLKWRNIAKNDKLDIIIKLGRTRMETLAKYLGFSHPRVLRCSQWLDKHVIKVQRPRLVRVA